MTLGGLQEEESITIFGIEETEGFSIRTCRGSSQLVEDTHSSGGHQHHYEVLPFSPLVIDSFPVPLIVAPTSR